MKTIPHALWYCANQDWRHNDEAQEVPEAMMQHDWEDVARSMRERVMWLVFFVGMYATYFAAYVVQPDLLANLQGSMPRWLAHWDITWLVIGAAVFGAWLFVASIVTRALFAGLPRS